MAVRGLYDTIKQAFQDIIAPQIEGLKGEMSGLKGEMNGLRGELRQIENGLRGELRQIEKRMEEGLMAIRTEIASVRTELTARIDFTNKRLEEALEIRERLATLEARVGARG